MRISNKTLAVSRNEKKRNIYNEQIDISIHDRNCTLIHSIIIRPPYFRSLFIVLNIITFSYK